MTAFLFFIVTIFSFNTAMAEVKNEGSKIYKHGNIFTMKYSFSEEPPEQPDFFECLGSYSSCIERGHERRESVINAIESDDKAKEYLSVANGFKYALWAGMIAYIAHAIADYDSEETDTNYEEIGAFMAYGLLVGYGHQHYFDKAVDTYNVNLNQKNKQKPYC